MVIDKGQWDSLSDDDAVALLYELANNGNPGGEEFKQLDAMVYRRLVQAYDVAANAKVDNPAWDIDAKPVSSSTVSDDLDRKWSFGDPTGTMA